MRIVTEIKTSKRKANKYTVDEFLKYLKSQNILLVYGDNIGETKLPEVESYYIKDDDLDNKIKS